MDSFITDLRYGLRMLLKTPGLTLVATLTIALGVGLTTHTFSVVYGSILRGLDFDEGTPLLSLSEDEPSQGNRGNSIPILDVIDWRSEQTSFRGIAGYTQGTVNLADEGSPPERYNGGFVSANLFAQVDATPVVGRVFTPQEEMGQGELVVILGYDVWQNRYAGAPNVIGRSVRVNAERATIVGVMPEGFRFPFNEDIWLPFRIDPLQAVRGGNRIQVVARLLEGVSIEQADVQMQGIASRIAAEYPETNEGIGVWVQTYEEQTMPPEIVAVLWLMLVAVFGVLLIACFNVANLLLARAAVRSREIAIRSSLGADRSRLVRQLMMEATMLAAIGGLGGVALGWIGIEMFNAAILDVQKPYWIDIRLDAPALLFTIAITGFASLAAGTVPAIRASGAKISEILQDESRGSSSFRMGRFSGALVIGEIALSCALLVTAGMMIKSVINVNRLDMGFESDQIFTARLGLFEADYPDDASRLRFYERLVEELSSEPGAAAAGLVQNLPALGSGMARIALDGVAYPELRDQPLSNVTSITPSYFDVLGTRVSAGRNFGDSDRNGSVPVAIVNESFAAKHFAGASALEQRFRVNVDGPWLTIVGVVPDVYVGGGGITGTGGIPDQYFIPLAQGSDVRFISLAVKTRGEPGAFASTAIAAVQRIDPGLPLYWQRTMDESVQTTMWIFTIFGSLFTVFGMAALFLAAVGLYGVMSFSVSLRTQEMGIRMALGASARTVFGLVLGKGMRQLAIGAVFGLAMGAAMAQPLAVVFFDVEPSDAMVYLTIMVTMGLTGLLACMIPANRATRVQLVDALRPE
ncbi:MAG: ABC transporter permease [Gemmatimonadetes bacterium]|nr:ABC transporter permease [Gemmatimonadota bacterium]